MANPRSEPIYSANLPKKNELVAVYHCKNLRFDKKRALSRSLHSVIKMSSKSGHTKLIKARKTVNLLPNAPRCRSTSPNLFRRCSPVFPNHIQQFSGAIGPDSSDRTNTIVNERRSLKTPIPPEYISNVSNNSVTTNNNSVLSRILDNNDRALEKDILNAVQSAVAEATPTFPGNGSDRFDDAEDHDLVIAGPSEYNSHDSTDNKDSSPIMTRSKATSRQSLENRKSLKRGSSTDSDCSMVTCDAEAVSGLHVRQNSGIFEMCKETGFSKLSSEQTTLLASALVDSSFEKRSRSGTDFEPPSLISTSNLLPVVSTFTGYHAPPPSPHSIVQNQRFQNSTGAVGENHTFTGDQFLQISLVPQHWTWQTFQESGCACDRNSLNKRQQNADRMLTASVQKELLMIVLGKVKMNLPNYMAPCFGTNYHNFVPDFPMHAGFSNSNQDLKNRDAEFQDAVFNSVSRGNPPSRGLSTIHKLINLTHSSVPTFFNYSSRQIPNYPESLDSLTEYYFDDSLDYNPDCFPNHIPCVLESLCHETVKRNDLFVGVTAHLNQFFFLPLEPDYKVHHHYHSLDKTFTKLLDSRCDLRATHLHLKPANVNFNTFVTPAFSVQDSNRTNCRGLPVIEQIIPKPDHHSILSSNDQDYVQNYGFKYSSITGSKHFANSPVTAAFQVYDPCLTTSRDQSALTLPHLDACFHNGVSDAALTQTVRSKSMQISLQSSSYYSFWNGLSTDDRKIHSMIEFPSLAETGVSPLEYRGIRFQNAKTSTSSLFTDLICIFIRISLFFTP